jgi:uncharacterized protein
MSAPLMPKATAAWLIENTALTFDQIADFCGLHLLEVQALADDEGQGKIQGMNPILSGQITDQEIKRCEKNSEAHLTLTKNDYLDSLMKRKGPKYTPISKRQDKPDAIAWILKNHPELSEAQICKLIGTTKNTIQAIRSRSHWNISHIKSQHPVLLHLCTEQDLNEAILLAQKNAPSSH